jgi:hypothetical protein
MLKTGINMYKTCFHMLKTSINMYKTCFHMCYQNSHVFFVSFVNFFRMGKLLHKGLVAVVESYCTVCCI